MVVSLPITSSAQGMRDSNELARPRSPAHRTVCSATVRRARSGRRSATVRTFGSLPGPRGTAVGRGLERVVWGRRPRPLPPASTRTAVGTPHQQRNAQQHRTHQREADGDIEQGEALACRVAAVKQGIAKRRNASCDDHGCVRHFLPSSRSEDSSV